MRRHRGNVIWINFMEDNKNVFIYTQRVMLLIIHCDQIDKAPLLSSTAQRLGISCLPQKSQSADGVSARPVE